MKNFLLMAGDNHYPEIGTKNWIGFFETFEEANNRIQTIEEYEYFTKGQKKGQIKSTTKKYLANGRSIDWYEIVNLEAWIEQHPSGTIIYSLNNVMVKDLK